MLSYKFAKNEIEKLHDSIVRYQNATARKQKMFFARRIRNDGDTLNDFVELVPASLRMEAKRAVRRAEEALKH